MAAEPKRVSIDSSADISALAEEVRSTREVKILQRNNEDVALIAPIAIDDGEGMSMNDPLWNIVGIDSSGERSDVAGDKYKHFDDVYGNVR